jgi:predicted MPP superfamily phosphohydrolase
VIVQTILCLAHWFLYRTWIDFWWPLSPAASFALRIALAALSVIFIIAAILSFEFSNPVVRFSYWLASIWLGIANFLFVGACLAWLADLALRLILTGPAHLAARPYIAGAFVIASIITALYGILNARNIRQRRLTVRLSNLPARWRGRTALLISDLHLGHINGEAFAQRIASMARQLDPAILFITGDLYDGSRVDLAGEAAPIWELSPPLGIYYVSGNHEVFGGSAHYEEVLSRAGIRVLHNERAVVGVPYGNSTYPVQLRTFLEGLELNNGTASIFLNHVPSRLPIAAHAGVSLQLSGHTHGGQIFPFNLITRRAFGRFTYGLHRFGPMQVYTSSGCGTWGPPMRVGTHPEIVLLTFE